MNTQDETSFQMAAPRDPMKKPEDVPDSHQKPAPAIYRPDDNQDDKRLKRRNRQSEKGEHDEAPIPQPDR